MFKDLRMENEYNKAIRKMSELFCKDGGYDKNVLECINNDIMYGMEQYQMKLSSDMDRLKGAFSDAPESIHKVCLKDKSDNKVVFRNFSNDDKMVVTKTSHIVREKNGREMLDYYLDKGYELVEVVYKKEIFNE